MHGEERDSVSRVLPSADRRSLSIAMCLHSDAAQTSLLRTDPTPASALPPLCSALRSMSALAQREAECVCVSAV